jgi:iron complex transport system substrate-binding protein
MPRIISLLPSATEMVCALGCGAQLVGRSHACDFPAEVHHLPVCTEAPLPPATTSRPFSGTSPDLQAPTLSPFHLDLQRLHELQPDLILTQAMCDLCAISEAEVARALGHWPGPPPQLLSFTPHRLAGVWEDFLRLAAALGVAAPGKEILRALKLRCVDVIERACLLPRPTVACLEWLDPLMGAGHWMPELVELAGGKNLFGTAGQPTARLRWEDLRAANPAVLLALPCGFELAHTQAALAALTQLPGWADLAAVRQHRVFACDGSAYFNRPGPRLVDSLEILAEILHPKKFLPRHAGTAWRQVS